jgi:hypothetical protein
MAHKTSDALSHLSEAQLHSRRAELAGQFGEVASAVRGSLHRQARRCGKEGCRCARGELHGPYVYLSMRSGRRRGLVYIPSQLAEEVGRRVELTSRVEAALAEISAINLELLARGQLD